VVSSELRSLPVALRAYLAVVIALWAGAAGWLVPGSALAGRDLVIAGLLLASGALSVETTRWVGQPAGTMVRDLLSVWWLPMAVLLPPMYVLLAPVPLLALTQWRVSRSLVHRRVFSAASIGLAYAAASWVFHAVLPEQTEAPSGAGLLRWALVAAAVGVLGAGINALLVAVAVKGADPQTRWRPLLLQPENLRVEGVEACVGVTVAVLMGLEPALVAFTLPPVLMLQRGLLHAHLRSVALLDGKTGLLNAPSWEREAAGKLLALRRRRQPAAVLLIDVDHFKRVNDEHGHLAGDQVLRAVAEVLVSGVRDGDLVGRFGGEEFVALLPSADNGESARVAERLRDHVARLVVPLATGRAVAVTVSIGVAIAPPGALLVPELLAAADYCMYQAKAAGRNHVVLSG
jgi:diguanylate cyclase (GGDEF)-like protein